MAKRQGRQLSILIIPDDGSSTKEFKLGYGLIRGIAIGEILLFVLVILGGVFYSRSLYWESKALHQTRDNQSLQNEMRQVGELADAVSRMKRVERQLHAMLSPAVELPTQPVAASTPPPSFTTEVRTTRTVGRLPSRGLSMTDTRLVPDVWPVGRFEGIVTQEFVPPTGTIYRSHGGIDIAATKGAIVTATADGRVVFAGEDETLGLVISIDHFGAFLTRYGHNAVLLTRTGEAVRKGQPVALVGNTGKSKGPHLHYEIWQQGTPRNPRDFLPGS